MKKKQPDKTAPVSETAQKTVSGHRSFLYLDDEADINQQLPFHHNHRTMFWYSGAWGRSLPTSIVHLVLPVPCLQLLSRSKNQNSCRIWILSKFLRDNIWGPSVLEDFKDSHRVAIKPNTPGNQAMTPIPGDVIFGVQIAYAFLIHFPGRTIVSDNSWKILHSPRESSGYRPCNPIPVLCPLPDWRFSQGSPQKVQ